MELFANGLSFIISLEYNLVIPHLDVSKTNIDLFNSNTINEWKQFIHSFGNDYKTVVKLLKARKYKTIEKTNLTLKIPFGYKTCIWETYPDLYNCSDTQVLLFLEKTQTRLSDIRIKTSPSQTVVEFYVSPETFTNLCMSNYQKLTEILIHNGETNATMWCSVACWWNYSNGLSEQNYIQTTPTGFIDKHETRKQEISVDSSFENDDTWIKILNDYCCPKLFTRCNWFMMLHARAILNKSVKMLEWIEENKKYVVWDEDLLSDTPTYAFNECYKYYDNIPMFANELIKRGIYS